MSDEGREHFAQDTSLWRWAGGNGGTWYFASFTGPVAEAISAMALVRRLETGLRRGWGSLKVVACIGDTTWSTSIFPGGDGTWLLPVKRAVRDAEGIAEGVSFRAAIAV